LPRCEIDLATRPFMDSQTFAGTPPGGWARDNQEVEVVLGVQGITGQRLRALLLTTDGSGRTLYERLRKSRLMEAFTYSYALDEMPWDADTMAAREQMPYVALTIESGRFDPDPEDGGREISLGTDLMDDTYYDTPGFTLLGNEVELRGRARWDNATTVRRLLIAAKFGTEIDAAGNKTNAKVDIRNDNGASFLPELDNDVRRGKTRWNGSDAPRFRSSGVYEQLEPRTSSTSARTLTLALDAKTTFAQRPLSRTKRRSASIRAIYATRHAHQCDRFIDRQQAAGIIPAGRLRGSTRSRRWHAASSTSRSSRRASTRSRRSSASRPRTSSSPTRSRSPRTPPPSRRTR
jgi:hypothetical protein